VLFTKDGNVGMSAMFTKNDKAIVASGMVRLRLKAEAKKYNLTPEYLFIVLSLKETGIYPATRKNGNRFNNSTFERRKVKRIWNPDFG